MNVNEGDTEEEIVFEEEPNITENNGEEEEPELEEEEETREDSTSEEEEEMSDPFLGVAPRTQARTFADAAGFRASVKKEDRSNLSTNDMNKLQMAAETGLEQKYELLDAVSLSDTETLKAVYQMSIRTEELRESLGRYDMDGIFLVPDSFELRVSDNEYVPSATAKAINLFQNAAEVTTTLVCRFSEYVLKFGQNYHSQNMYWSAANILNSCGEKLREKLEETTIEYPTQHRTGPVYFVLMSKLILSSTPLSMRAVIRKLEDVKLPDFSGENVKDAISLIRGAVGLLRNNNSLPSDIVDIAFKIMKSSSTSEFNTHVTTMKTNHDTGVMKMSLDDLMLNLQNKFNELSINGDWNIGTGDSNQGSVFTCHTCGQEGHFWRQCPNPDRNRLADLMGRFGGRGHGRGRGGRRGRGGPNPSSSIFRIPPQAGQPHIRKRGPMAERWCGTCGVWGTHGTQQHHQAETAQCVDTVSQASHTAVSELTNAPTVDENASTTNPTNPNDCNDDGSIPALLLDFI